MQGQVCIVAIDGKRRTATWFDSFKAAGEGWRHLYGTLLLSAILLLCRDTFAMSRVKANWRRIATWFDGFKAAGEGWRHLQSWESPPATIGTMAALTSVCCFPHIMVSLALTGLIIFMVRPYLIPAKYVVRKAISCGEKCGNALLSQPGSLLTGSEVVLVTEHCPLAFCPTAVARAPAHAGKVNLTNGVNTGGGVS